jgi:hypothetical protein
MGNTKSKIFQVLNRNEICELIYFGIYNFKQDNINKKVKCNCCKNLFEINLSITYKSNYICMNCICKITYINTDYYFLKETKIDIDESIKVIQYGKFISDPIKIIMCDNCLVKLDKHPYINYNNNDLCLKCVDEIYFNYLNKNNEIQKNQTSICCIYNNDFNNDNIQFELLKGEILL